MVAAGAVAAGGSKVAVEAAAAEEATVAEVAEAQVTSEVIQEMAKEVGSEALKEIPGEIVGNEAVGAMPKEVMDTAKNIAKPADIIENVEKGIGLLFKDYISELKRLSEFPQTIFEELFDPRDLVKRTPEETKALRKEFDLIKDRLIDEWEKETGMKWPVYEHDVYDKYGNIVRKAGWRYDAHHIKPLSMGGTNEAKNITPLRYEVHSDHKGVHAKDSPYGKLEEALKGGINN